MKIGDVKDASAQIIQQYQRNENADQAIDKKSGGISVPEEKVNLSAMSKDLLQIKNAVANLPDMREEKIQELRTQIEKGTYKVDAGGVAQKMVGESLIDIFA